MPNLDRTWPKGQWPQTWAKNGKCGWNQNPTPRSWKGPGGCGQHKWLGNRRKDQWQDASAQEISSDNA